MLKKLLPFLTGFSLGLMTALRLEEGRRVEEV